MNEYKEMFNSVYAPKYEQEIFIKNTAKENEFLVEELKLLPVFWVVQISPISRRQEQ